MSRDKSVDGGDWVFKGGNKSTGGGNKGGIGGSKGRTKKGEREKMRDRKGGIEGDDKEIGEEIGSQ